MPIWTDQKLPVDLLDWLVGLAHDVNTVMNESSNGKNVAEWAKSEELWTVLKKRFLNEQLPFRLLMSQLIVPGDIVNRARERSEELQVIENERAFLKLILSVEDRVWEELRLWLNGPGKNLKTSNIQQEALRIRVDSKAYLDEKLAKKLVLLWQQAAKEGFPYPPTGDAE
jgi:hypothetical protein